MQNHGLSASEVRDLRLLAGLIIPPSATFRVPGADDDLIFSDILKSLDRDRDDVFIFWRRPLHQQRPWPVPCTDGHHHIFAERQPPPLGERTQQPGPVQLL